MAEKTGEAAENQQEFAIQRLYIKDLSLEAPNTPQQFREEWKPKVDLSLNTNSRVITPDVHEVSIKATVTAKNGDNVAFLVEAEQAGVFTVKNFPEENLKHMLGSYCPNILFPYLREVISDLVIRAGFPQLALAPVNFDALYVQAQKMQKEKQEKEAAE